MLQHAIRAAIILPVFVTAFVLSGGCGADPAGAISDVPVGSLQDDGVEPVVASETEEVPIGQPSAVIQANPSVGVAPLSVGLTTAGSSGGAGPIDTYSWQFDDGSFGSGPILYHTFAEPGVRTVALTVTDTYGATATAVKEVYVLPTFVIDTDPQDAAGAAPMTVAFSANTLAPIPDLPIDYALQWQFGDGESAEGWDVMHTYQQAGSYVATLTLVLATMSIDCAEQEVRVVQGDQTAAVVANAGGDQTVSPGTVVTLDGSGSRSGGDLGLMYTWAQTLGPAVTLSDPHAVAPTFEAPAVDEPTTLVFLLTVTDGQNPADDSVTITIVPSAPLLPPVANAGDDLVLPDGDRSGNENVTLDGSNSYDADGEIVQYLWMSGDTVLADGGNPQAEVALPVGEHVLTLIVRDNDDLTDSDNVTITITDGAALAVTPPSDFISSGTVGGPFVPAYKSYAVHNTGDEPLAWSAAKTQPWVSLSQTSGVLGAGESVTVVVTPNDAATELPAGEYSDPHITFTNETNGDGNTERSAALTVVEATMTTASRTTGVAPLAVFFDAVDTATPAWDSGVVQPGDGDFGAYYYEWNFGDDPSAVWNTTGLSKNEATGFVAAHVYEQPGTYSVVLRVTDTTGDVHEYVQEIEVLPFSGTTYYVSSSEGDDDNDGLSEEEPFETLTQAFAVMGSNCRILLKRGDEWICNAPLIAACEGPVSVADYGHGDKPVVRASTDLGSAIFATARDDWRFMNLHLIHNYDVEGGEGSDAIKTEAGATNTLMLRINARKTGAGALGPSFATNTFLQECDISDCRRAGVYIQQTRCAALMGCSIHQTQNYHNIYSNSIQKVVYSNNCLADAGGGRHNLRVCAEFTSNGWPSRYVTIVDNLIDSGTWLSVHIGPNRGSVHQEISDVLVERNSIWNCSQNGISIEAATQRIRVINNVVEAKIELESGSAFGDPGPRDVLIAHNTIINPNDDAALKVTGDDFGNVQIVNNILHSVTTSGWSVGLWVVDPAALTGVVSDHNLFYAAGLDRVARTGLHGSWVNYTLGDWQALGEDGSSTDTDTSPYVDEAGGDWRPAGGGAAHDTADTTSVVREDYARNDRPQGDAADIGAYERVE